MLAKLCEEWASCEKCHIGTLTRTRVMFDVVPSNSTTCDVLFVGEGPGEAEDALGRPFIGPAGRVLRQAIEEAVRGDLTAGFANLLACRPIAEGGGNRAPSYDEIMNCGPRLERLVDIVAPKLVVLCGQIPSDNIRLAIPNDFAQYRCIRHPSYILRSGGATSHLYLGYVQDIKKIFKEVRCL